MTDFFEQVPERTNTSTAISPAQLAGVQRQLVRGQPADPRDVGGLSLPTAEERTPDTIKK